MAIGGYLGMAMTGVLLLINTPLAAWELTRGSRGATTDSRSVIVNLWKLGLAPFTVAVLCTLVVVAEIWLVAIVSSNSH